MFLAHQQGKMHQSYQAGSAWTLFLLKNRAGGGEKLPVRAKCASRGKIQPFGKGWNTLPGEKDRKKKKKIAGGGMVLRHSMFSRNIFNRIVSDRRTSPEKAIIEAGERERLGPKGVRTKNTKAYARERNKNSGQERSVWGRT